MTASQSSTLQKTDLEQTFPIFVIEENKEEYREENEEMTPRPKVKKPIINDVESDVLDRDLTIKNDSNVTLSMHNPKSI